MSENHRVTQQTFPLTGLGASWLDKSRSGRCRAATEGIGSYPNRSLSERLTATTRKPGGHVERCRGEPIGGRSSAESVQLGSSGGGAT